MSLTDYARVCVCVVEIKHDCSIFELRTCLGNGFRTLRRGTRIRVLGFDISHDCISRLTVKSLAARDGSIREKSTRDPTRCNVTWPRSCLAASVAAAAAAAVVVAATAIGCIQARRGLRMRSSGASSGSSAGTHCNNVPRQLPGRKKLQVVMRKLIFLQARVSETIY